MHRIDKLSAALLLVVFMDRVASEEALASSDTSSTGVTLIGKPVSTEVIVEVDIFTHHSLLETNF